MLSAIHSNMARAFPYLLLRKTFLFSWSHDESVVSSRTDPTGPPGNCVGSPRAKNICFSCNPESRDPQTFGHVLDLFSVLVNAGKRSNQKLGGPATQNP